MVSVRVCVCLHILYTLYTMIQYPNIRPEMPIKMVVETEYMRVTNAYIYILGLFMLYIVVVAIAVTDDGHIA